MGRRWTLTGAAPDSGQPVVMYACQRWGLKFDSESYIGSKNKSNRVIGTYRRSKSAAVLESSNPNDQAGGSNTTNNNSSHCNDDSKQNQLGSWASESVLGQPEHSHKPFIYSHGKPSSKMAVGETPTRPARPSAARPPPTQTTPPSVSTNSASSRLYSSEQQQQQQQRGYRDSPRRQPPPVPNSPPYDTSHSPAETIPFSQYTPPHRSPHLPPPPEPCLDYSRKATHAQPFHTSPPLSQTNHAPVHTSPPLTQSNHQSPPLIQSNHQSPPLTQTNHAPSHHSPPLSQTNHASLQASPPVTLPSPAPSGHDVSRLSDVPPRPPFHRRESVPVTTCNPAVRSEVTGYGWRRKSESAAMVTSRLEAGEAGHSRQPSQEELECDRRAKELASELDPQESKLSEVLRTDATKKRMQYMDGLFEPTSDLTASYTERGHANNSTIADPETNGESEASTGGSTRPPLPHDYWVPERDVTTGCLQRQKEELLDKLHRKLEVLRGEKQRLQEEIGDNNALGLKVSQRVDARCHTRSERDKFHTYIDDLEKIVRLLLNLSGQLARAENACQALQPSADPKLKKMTLDKRERLQTKHEEAKLLKDDIDKRSEQLSGQLRDRLDGAEFADYSRYIQLKSQLTIELQELEDKITLGGEQIQELRKSIPGATPR